MESPVKRKKRLKKKATHEDLTKIVSSPIPTTPMSNIRLDRDPKTFSKSVHRCQTPIEEENLIPKPSKKRIFSARPTQREVGNPNKQSESSLKNFLKEDWKGKAKKFLEGPKKFTSESSRTQTKLQEIVSSPIPVKKTSLNKLSKTSGRCQSTSKLEPNNLTPIAFRRANSVQTTRPIIFLNGEKVSSSKNSVGKPSAPKEYLPIRYTSKVEESKAKKKEAEREKRFLRGENVPFMFVFNKPPVMPKMKKTRKSTTKRLREMLKSFSGKKDLKSLKEDCDKIAVVFDNRKKKERAIRMENLNILGKLYLLIAFGGVEEDKPQETVIHYIIDYLCSNSYLLSQLVYIMADSEDLKTCMFTTKVLYQLLIKSWTVDDAEKAVVKSAMGAPSIFGILTESMYAIHQKFASNMEYKEEMQKIHSHILQMIMFICNKSHINRRQFRHVSEGTIKLISKLVGTCHENNLDLARALLEAVNTICMRKSNCIYLANKKFFDGICLCYELTRKMYCVPVILKIMSRNKQILNIMSGNLKLINLIIELICYSGKKSVNKPALLATLNRISTDKSGLKLLKKNEIFYKLFYYFRKEDEHKSTTTRLGRIKAYTILNRSSNQIVLPNIELRRELGLPEIVKKCLEEETVSDESESENDESEEDSEIEEDSDENEASTFDVSMIKIHRNETEEILTDMSPYYVEFLLSSDDMNYHSIFKFDIYEGIVHVTNKNIIESRVHREFSYTKHAYPDCVMLDPVFDDHVLKSSINQFSKENLSMKLKYVKGIQQNIYTPNVIYDLDHLHDCNKYPPQVPHPNTFVYCKIVDRSQLSPMRSLKFESRFECGNLRKVVQIETFEYELLLTPDTSSSKGLQWFYFQVSNMVSDTTYTFNIANFLKCNSQYNYGMQPLMFSVIDYTLHKKGWQRVGEEIIYYGNNYTDENGNIQYRTLTFSCSFPYSNDYVYFAYHYPYTYTRLMIKLFPFVNYKSSDIYARLDKLCNTVKGRNELALLTITGAWNSPHSLGIPLRRRPIIFITGRVHPGETNASWIMEGIINFLLKQMDPNAVAAREHFIFKIIPMLNPEGVIYGNSRNGLTGSDLNRCWARPNKTTCPEIYYAKRFIACAKKQLKLPIAAYIDIHGHSRKKFFFFYGCNPKASWNRKDKMKGEMIDTLRILPDMVRETNPNIRLSQCKYKITKNRESTGRVVMWREFDIKHSYTLECSYSFASDKQSVNTKILSEIGCSVVASLGKLADKAYSSKTMVPSLSLDFSYVSNIPSVEGPPLGYQNMKPGKNIASMFPLYVNSRAFPANTLPNRLT